MHCDGGIDQIAAQRAEPRQGAILVGASKPAVADHIRRQNRCEFPGLGHDAPSPQARLAQKAINCPSEADGDTLLVRSY